MNITNSHRAMILSELRDSGMTQKKLAEELGYGRPWVSKLLNGTLKTVSDEDALKLEKLLGVKFLRLVDSGSTVSGLAAEIGKLADENPQFARVLAELIPLAQDGPMTPRYIPTKEMTKIGQEIIRLVFANEDKPGKVAREVLKLLA